jgi:hypothetical protein
MHIFSKERRPLEFDIHPSFTNTPSESKFDKDLRKTPELFNIQSLSCLVVAFDQVSKREKRIV